MKQADEQHEKRVAQLQGIALRRLKQMGLARGWAAWLAKYEIQTRSQTMLRQAAARLVRPYSVHFILIVCLIYIFCS